MRYFSQFVLIILGVALPSLSWSSDVSLPDGSSFIGLIQDEWHGFIVDNGSLVKLDIPLNIQELVYMPEIQTAFYIDSSDKLYGFDINEGSSYSIKLSENINKVTQISAFKHREGDWALIGVSLEDSKSVHTDLVTFNLKLRRVDRVLKSRVTVFEPNVKNEKVVYVGLNCVELCQKPVQEVWVGDVKKANHKQLTLENTYLKFPVWSTDGAKVYFSKISEIESSIAQLDIDSGEVTSITDGFWDTQPRVHNNDLYFLRKKQSSVEIYKFKDGELEEVPVPNMESIREFRVNADV